MPQVRVAVWNIQNFGAQGQTENRGTDNQLLANFIRDFAEAMNLDAIGIMEVSRYALPCLRALQTTLNAGLIGADADWAFDWIKSSVADGAAYPPVAPGGTSWNGGGARNEGSALFWRANRPAFRIVPALQACSQGAELAPPAAPGGNYLNMVTRGLDFDWVSTRNWDTTTGYNPNRFLTLSFDENLLAAAWARLDFPWVTTLRYQMPRQFESRRPVFAVLELNNGAVNDGDRLVPFIFYHAPSNQTLAELGTFLGACSLELNVTHGLLVAPPHNQDPATLVRARASIMGGDFNKAAYVRTNLGPFKKYTFPYRDTVNTGGSSMEPANLYGERTTVQLRDQRYGHFSGEPIDGVDNADYLFLPIDQLFYRNLQHVSAVTGVYNMLGQLRSNITIFRRSLLAYRDHLQEMIDDSRYRPNPVSGPIDDFGRTEFGDGTFTNWTSFWRDLKNPPTRNRPYFTTARSAAEFYRVFISDHLPITLAFRW